MKVQDIAKVAVVDGCCNSHIVFIHSLESKGVTGVYNYDPVTPIESSSGEYDGGVPVKDFNINPESVLKAVLDCYNDKDNQVLKRNMGTGIVTITTLDGDVESFYMVRTVPAMANALKILETHKESAYAKHRSEGLAEETLICNVL